ncbi:MAG: type II toxin-antitoxin system RelE/ParE family toxin [Thermodesulfobacteriota bacterium]|jgi:phage-related protein
MPRTAVYFYQEANGEVPVWRWLTALAKHDRRAFAKCAAKIRRLEDKGHELRRPDADYLEDGIYELRAKKGHSNYRILYFFHGQNVALLCHALTKERTIPPADLARAKARKTAFEKNPETHTAAYRLTGD